MWEIKTYFMCWGDNLLFARDDEISAYVSKNALSSASKTFGIPTSFPYLRRLGTLRKFYEVSMVWFKVEGAWL